jgi:hypothetical protein
MARPSGGPRVESPAIEDASIEDHGNDRAVEWRGKLNTNHTTEGVRLEWLAEEHR